MKTFCSNLQGTNSKSLRSKSRAGGDCNPGVHKPVGEKPRGH